jgi:uncharacterized repeat protein (TIGR01451 family)
MLRRLVLLAVVANLLGASLAWAQTADLSITKTGPAEAAADSDVTYTVTVTNNGPDALSEGTGSATLTDNIPVGMTFVSATPPGCTTPLVGFGGTITCTISVLSPTTSIVFTFVFHIPSNAAPGTSFTNVATVSLPNRFDPDLGLINPDPNEENNSAFATTTVPGGSAQADLGVVKTGPSSAAPDTDVVYTIVVTNGGPAAATNVILSDTLPGTMTFVSPLSQSGTPLNCNESGGTVTCTAASYPAGGSTTITLTGHIPSGTLSGTTFTNTATVSTSSEGGSSDPNSENNSSQTTLTVSSVDVSVTKTGPATVTAGDTISYTLTVSNAGPDVATNVNLSDTLPPNTTFVSLTPNNAAAAAASCSAPPDGGTGTVTCTFDVLTNGASAEFTLMIRAGNTTSVINTATVTTDSFDRNQTNNSASATTSVTPKADVGITKAGPGTVTPGADVTYTLTIINNGPSSAASVSITDVVAAPFTFVSLTQTTGPTFSCSTPAAGATGTITCSIATLAPGASATFSLVLHLSSAAGSGSVSNTAIVTTSTADPEPANDASTTTATLGATADVGVTITGPPTGTPGSNITYTVTVTNAGPSTASDASVAPRALVPAATVTVTIVLSPNTTFVSLTQTAGPTFACVTPAVGATGNITCTIATLAPGASATFSIVVNIPLGAAGQITSTASVTATTPDPNPANNASTVVINLEPPPLPAPTSIPTLSPSSFALLGLGLALAGFYVLRRRRPTRTH